MENLRNELALRISSINGSVGNQMSEIKDVLKVTFDSNVLLKVLQPEFVPNLGGVDVHDLQIVNEAIKMGRVEGFVAKTFFTKEAIPKVCREDIYRIAFRRYRNLPSQPMALRLNKPNLKSTPAKKQLNGENVFARRNLLPLLREYHVRILHTYLWGDILPQMKSGESVEDVFRPDDFYHWDGDEGEVMERNNVCFRFIVDDLNVGVLCVNAIDNEDNKSDEGPSLISKFSKYVAEEADVQAIATHYAHQIDIFCTEDKGKSAGCNSVMKAENKAALSQKFGIQFCTLGELVRLLEDENVTER